MSNSTAQVLMKKGKRGAAAYIHADCASGSPQHLGPLLDVLLNPSKAIDEWETLDWCRWLIAGGRTPDEFASVVRSYDQHDKCGLVWVPRVVAYRCRTCGISPCMSICRECFHRGDHSTHDFNMFLSQAGGACDCGDNSVMKEDGFCSNHGNSRPRPGTAPAELMCVAEAMMPRLILRLLQHFRENSCGAQTNSDSYRITVQECEGYVQMLMELNNMGDLMRSAMTKALINPQMYRNLVEPPFPETEYGSYMGESHNMYERALDSFPAPEPPDEYRHLPALAPRLQHNTLLDEFIFWTFKYEFPQNVVCFLLNMLPDQDYKEHLTRTFVMHYARIPLVLEAAGDPDTLSNRVVHMSVQLFSNEALALRCVQQLHLLHVMVLSLRLMMGKILVGSALHAAGSHAVIDCTRRVMKEHCYWPLVSDFNNVLSHRSVALLFLQDAQLRDMWFQLLNMLQGMNANVREMGGHIEFEPSSYYAAFSCELEAAAYPMWSVLSHLTEPEHAGVATRMIAVALTYLHEWLDAVRVTDLHTDTWDMMHASFHFPLHRYLSAFLCAATRSMGVRADAVLPPPDLLLLLALHPLRVQSLFYEILAGVWVRNGLQIKGQAMTYIQANFCNSMVDLDIYWLQICAAHLPPNQFIQMCINMFSVKEWTSMCNLSSAQATEQDAMVEGLLTFLAILVSSRTNLGNDELTQSRLEVSTLLAAGDKTHSQLLELMPERSGNAHTRNFETVLKELSTYRPPPKGSENLEQGLFVPRAAVWEHYYDPLHVLRRAVHRRDFHTSMDRFTAYVREKQKAEGSNTSSSKPEVTASGAGSGAGSEAGSGADNGAASGASSGAGALWPPLRAATAPPPEAGDPRIICTSGVLHGALLAVLHRGVLGRRRDSGAPHAPPDHVLALAVFLLGTACDVAAEQHGAASSSVCVAGGEGSGGARVGGRPLLHTFTSEHICDNARTFVTHVAPPAAHPASHVYPADYHSDSDTEWEPSEEGAGKSALPAHTTALAVPAPREMIRNDSLTDEQSDGSESGLRALPHSEELRLALLPPHQHYDEDLGETEWVLSLRQQALEAEEAPQPSNTQVQLGGAGEEGPLIPVHESLISVLLKLHSQLSGRLDSFSLDEPPPDYTQPIGDGPYFIGQVLHKLARLDARCAATIHHVRKTLWPHQRERQAEQRARERREKEERSRRARERQQQLMKEFQKKQQQFLSAMQSQEEGMEWEGEELLEKDYDCVICNTTAPSTPANPMGLVVLLQSTSVLGHRRRAGSGEAKLPLTESDRTRLAALRDSACAAHYYRQHLDLAQHFRQDSWLLGVSVGWEGGVHAATCGHHLHLACLGAYMRSLAAPHRPHNLHVERGEFLCPVCRQLANSVLPCGAERPSLPPHLSVQRLLDAAVPLPPPPPPSRLSEAMGKAMEDMTATAGGKLKQRYGSSPAAIFTFVASLVRTNLECELVQRGGNLLTVNPPRYKPRNDCIVPLMVVAGVHARVFRCAGVGAAVADSWRQLAGGVEESSAGEQGGACVPARGGGAQPVPLLLADPLAVLMQLLLCHPTSPTHYDTQHFTSIVRALYSLCYYQIVCQFLATASAEGRAALRAASEGETSRELLIVARTLLRALEGSELFTEDGLPPPAPPAPDLQAMEVQLEELLLPFVRICALVKHHLYGTPLPLIESAPQELGCTLEYLGLEARLPGAAHPAGASWARQLAGAADRGQLVVRRLLSSLHVVWAPPSLLSLPREYDRVFTHYHERVCQQCGGVPKEASLCLLCGTLVCLKQPCCRRHQVAEATQHAMECGGGTGIFLVVTTTYIIVIRARRACLWGSLYLDDYDEEDRDLKRGKPLYLSADRSALLQAQWVAHRFDHTKRTWVWHRDSL